MDFLVKQENARRHLIHVEEWIDEAYIASVEFPTLIQFIHANEKALPVPSATTVIEERSAGASHERVSPTD